MVADSRLRNVAARGEVAGADLAAARELAQDREPRGVRDALEQQGIGIGQPFHGEDDIDKYQYGGSVRVAIRTLSPTSTTSCARCLDSTLLMKDD